MVDAVDRSAPTGGRAVRNVIAVAGGDPVPPTVLDRLPSDALVIADDSGLQVATSLGLTTDIVVGDMDSVDPALLERARAGGAEVQRHPAAKNHTDLELALDVALGFDPARIVVVGGHGGRLDHLIANVLLLARPAHDHLDLSAHMGEAEVHVVHTRCDLVGIPGELVSLMPVHGPVEGVTTDGLPYPLAGEDLAPGSTRGVSNELAQPSASVQVTGGTLLVVRPGALGTHVLSRTEPTP